MDERRDDFEAGDASRDKLGVHDASKGERERLRWFGSMETRLGDISAGDIGRDMGVKEGSDFARMRPRRPNNM